MYGLYQYCGTHPVYGRESLLYIGQAFDRDFSKRLSEHVHETWSSTPIEIFLGFIASREKLDEDSWRNEVDLAEALLIYTHSPAWNSSNIKTIDYSRFDGVHIFNWGDRGSLLPEVSYERWCGTGNEAPKDLTIQK